MVCSILYLAMTRRSSASAAPYKRTHTAKSSNASPYKRPPKNVSYDRQRPSGAPSHRQQKRYLKVHNLFIFVQICFVIMIIDLNFKNLIDDIKM